MQDFTDPAHSARKIPSPFLDDIFVRNNSPLPGTAEIHQQAMSQCISILENLISETDRPKHWGAIGRTILISAPRAGYGKSHLIARLRSTTESLIAAVDLPFDPSRSISWKMVLASFLRQYSQTRCPQQTSCSLLEETARFFLANLVRSSISHGEISEKNCPENDAAMRLEYRELFDRSSKSKILTWVSKRGSDLARTAAAPMKARWNLGQSEVTFWAGLFLDYTHGREDALDPLRGLSNGEAHARVIQLMRIASECRPITVIVDHLDGFYGSDTAGMAIAEILTSIRTEVSKTLTLLCINDDLWDSVFEKQIPSAWLDRLTGETTRLKPVTSKSARALIASRLAGINVGQKQVDEFISELSRENDWGDLETILYPRDIIRQARRAWEKGGRKYFPPRPELSSPSQKQSFVPSENIHRTTVKSPSKTFSQAPVREKTETESTMPVPPVSRPPVNPVPLQTEMNPQENAPLASGIESIIDDIRGTGFSVMSDGPGVDSPPAENKPLDSPFTEPEKPIQAGSLSIRQLAKKKNGFGAAKKVPASLDRRKENDISHSPMSADEDPEKSLREREAQLSHSSQTLQLDLPRIENLVRTIGKHHSSLNQSEEHFPSSRSVCLRWKVSERSVLIGFDSPQNIYFWNTLLQQSFEGDETEKITSFSHRSQPFDPSLFTSFGFSHDLVDSRLDIVEMNDKELAMVYAAESLISDSAKVGTEARAIEIVTRRLDPLWRRIIQPIAVHD